jgi:hypothetical protein
MDASLSFCRLRLSSTGETRTSIPERRVLELVFIACLKLSPADCSERRLAFISRSDLAVCTLHAQRHLADWARTHSDFTITSWRCEDPSRRPTDA